MIMVKCNCGREFLTVKSLNPHARFCKDFVKMEKPVSKYKVGGIYKCECEKTFEKSQSLNVHFSHCLVHRNGVPVNREHVKNKIMAGWDKFTEEDKQSFYKKGKETFKASGKKRKKTSDETKLKLSKALKGRTGGFRKGCNKWKGINIIQDEKTIWLDSSYEKRFVDFLNLKNIKWIKNYKKFDYIYETINRKYIPDFYLPAFNLWIEIKGMEKPNDIFKWNFFPYKLKIIRNKELSLLESNDIQLNDILDFGT